MEQHPTSVCQPVLQTPAITKPVMLGIHGELDGDWLQEPWSPVSMGSNAKGCGHGVRAGNGKDLVSL